MLTSSMRLNYSDNILFVWIENWNKLSEACVMLSGASAVTLSTVGYHFAVCTYIVSSSVSVLCSLRYRHFIVRFSMFPSGTTCRETHIWLGLHNILFHTRRCPHGIFQGTQYQVKANYLKYVILHLFADWYKTQNNKINNKIIFFF